MPVVTRMARLYLVSQPPPSSLLRRSSSIAAACSSADFPKVNKECKEFLPWLRQKTGHEISPALLVGVSIFGRSLFASRSIRAGECILKVPFSAQITTDELLPGISPLLGFHVGNVSRLAVVLLAEQKLGQDSKWAPYIKSLPCISDMHSTVFWSNDELEMIRQSTVYHETINKRMYIEEEFSAVRLGIEQCPQFFGDCRLEHFMYGYALVESRAWGTSKGASLVPFADFLNHDGTSEMILQSDDDKEISEVIADRNYVADEQVLIRYGKFSNATLLLDFGFTLPYNVYDKVQFWIDIPLGDPLYAMKVELLRKYCLPTTMNPDGFNSSGSSFVIKEVKDGTAKGKGIPQSLRAFARVLSTSTIEELKDLVAEAAEIDGRLARRSLKNRKGELLAHRILHSRFTHLIQGKEVAIKVLQSTSTSDDDNRLARRRKMAIDLLSGELRVLRSACSWLENYCESLSSCESTL